MENTNNRQQDVFPTPLPDQPPEVKSIDSNEKKEEQSEEKIVMNALNLSWCFGYNKHIDVLNLCVNESKKIFLSSSHIGIVYDFETNAQTLLQGHRNSISCCTVSDDKRWLITADMGPDSTIIVWDLNANIPVQTYFNTHIGGTISVAITPDSKYIASLSANEPQVLAIWEWTSDNEMPLCTAELEPTYNRQNNIRFNPDNTFELVTNSSTQVIFYEWNERNGFVYFAPVLNDQTFNKPVGKLTQSVFQSINNRALTGTSLGNLVVWQTVESKEKTQSNKKPLKLFKFQDKSINYLTLFNDRIVIGDSDGHLKFIDQHLHILITFRHFNLGPIGSLSFSYASRDFESKMEISDVEKDATLHQKDFVCKDLIINTTNSTIGFITKSGTKVDIISRCSDNSIFALACHPSLPRICFGNNSGFIQLWNYEEKCLISSRNFNKGFPISCISFDPTGNHIALGFKNGHLQIIDSISLEDCLKVPFTYSKDEITFIEFSRDSVFLATAEIGGTISVYKYNFKSKSEEKIASEMYTFLGRYKSHYKDIVGIIFVENPDTGENRLLSLGKDRILVEFDLERSSYDELVIKEKIRIEQYAIPLGILWYQPEDSKETFLLTANNQWKYKLYNSTTKMCRKTLLGPTFGSLIKKMVLMPSEGTPLKNRYMAYINENKLGLQKFPLTGNPFDSISIFAHPDGVTNLAHSFDGKYLFTSGGHNNNVFMWNVNFKALETQSILGGPDLKPFYGLIDGGREGDFFKEMKQLFYYSQLRNQGLHENVERVIGLKIPLSEIPYVMRGLGFYPTEQEIENMINEVKFCEYAKTNKLVEEINLDEFIKLYINHRPAFGLDPYEIYNAFSVLKRAYNVNDRQSLPRNIFLNEIQKRGEHMTDYELAECLSNLLYLNREVDEMSKDQIESLIDSHLAENLTVDSFMSELIGIPNEDFETILDTWENIQQANRATTARSTN